MTIRKYWQIDKEILAMLAEGDKRITEISNGCLISHKTANNHLELMRSHKDAQFNAEAKQWAITAKGRGVLAVLEGKK